jgi:hypothetical protein
MHRNQKGKTKWREHSLKLNNTTLPAMGQEENSKREEA